MAAGSQTITMNIAADNKPFKKGLDGAVGALGTFTKALGPIGAAIGVAFSVKAITDFVTESVKLADESRQISRSLQTAVTNSKAFGSSSKYISKVTDELDAASGKLGELTGIDDEVISGLKRNWLSIPNIARTGVKGINNLALTAANVAAGTGKDLESVASAFTKAYGDPKGAVAKLQKAGVVLSQNERDRYDLLIKQGKQQEALSYLADTLNGKYKGQAEASASPFARMQVSFQNFQENLGKAFLPILDKTLPLLQDALTKLALDPNFQKGLEEIAGWLSTELPKVLQWLRDNMPAIASSIKTFADTAVALANALFPSNRVGTTEQVKTAGVKMKAADIAYQHKTNGAYMNYGNGVYITNNIHASSVDTSANTGKAIVSAMNSYARSGGRLPK